MILDNDCAGGEGDGEYGDEPVLDLATALSVAVRVEPELIRAVRLALFPRFGVETEAELWFSGLVRSQGAEEIVFETEVRRRLHRRLGGWLRRQPPDAPVHSLWRVVERVHRDLSPALFLEERVTWLAVAGRPAEIDNALAPVFKAIAHENRDGLKQWLASAWNRLPQDVRDSPTGWQLAQAARPWFAAGRFPSRTERAPLPARRLGDLTRLLDDVRITVRRDGDELELDGRAVDTVGPTEVPPGTYALSVPDTAPRLLTLLSGGLRDRDEELSVPADWQVRVSVGAGPVRLRTARGHVFLVPERALPLGGGGLGGRFLGISVTRYDDGLLPPLDTEPDLCREVGGALGADYVREYLADPSAASVIDRLRRLRMPRGGPLVLYFRGYAAEGPAHPMLVLRDSDPARPETCLDSETVFRLVTTSGAEQVIVVMDTVRTPGGDRTWGYPPQPMELGATTWTGQVAAAMPYEVGGEGPFGRWLARLLRRGPDEVPQGWGWLPRNRYITGGDLMRAVAADWPGESPSTPRNFAAGVPRDLLPNPRYALRRFPDDLRPSDFGEVYAQEAAAFLREVISEPTTSADDRDRAVSNMMLLGPNRGVEAAAALDELAGRYAASKNLADAVAANESAVALLRPLAERLPDTALPALATSLYGLASLLAEAYRWVEARPPAEESVALRRRLADRDPEQRPRLAESLHLWSLVLQSSGESRAALHAALETVDLLRGLTRVDPVAHRSALAVGLGSLVDRYGAVERPVEALRAAGEAVDLRRVQAASDPRARAALAQSLHVRWHWERVLQRWESAHQAIAESVAIHRELAAQRPDAAHPQLAEVLHCLAVNNADRDRVTTALVVGREAVGIYSNLVAHGAVDLRQALARGLRNLSLWLGAVGQSGEAVSNASQAVGIYRELEAEQSGLLRAELADALEVLSHALDLLGDGRPRALDAAREAVGIYRRLAEARPEAYWRNLAKSLNVLSIRLDTVGRGQEAARLREEVRDIVFGRGSGP
ncbi:hypothetical protein ACIRPU_03005 [Streptomyces sp. NPDC102259]|uniref:hypothetical protein n=1 Tax=Streptomyces sp. NPDC102259 TaxID=3366148 RepID=UPI003817F767